MILKKFTLDSLDSLLKKAYTELYKFEQEKSDQKCIWGFFPGFEEGERDLYPQCFKLKKLLDKNFTRITGQADRMELSFIKIASKKPPVEFGGLHLDTDVSSTEDSSHQGHILRLILNLGTYPRDLKYTKYTATQLKAMGVEIARGEYRPINLPANIPTSVVKIPPRNRDTLSGLLFWASEIPHVGLTNEHGYFIAGYGGVFKEIFDLKN